MAKIYANLILSGAKVFSDVPDKLKTQVKRLLEKEGVIVDES